MDTKTISQLRQHTIKDKFDTEWTIFPTCPHCGEADQDWWDGLPPKNDGDTWTVGCGFCDKPYEVTMSVSTHFDTKKMKEQSEPES